MIKLECCDHNNFSGLNPDSSFNIVCNMCFDMVDIVGAGENFPFKPSRIGVAIETSSQGLF
jgi:hypothetical protein